MHRSKCALAVAVLAILSWNPATALPDIQETIEDTVPDLSLYAFNLPLLAQKLRESPDVCVKVGNLTQVGEGANCIDLLTIPDMVCDTVKVCPTGYYCLSFRLDSSKPLGTFSINQDDLETSFFYGIGAQQADDVHYDIGQGKYEVVSTTHPASRTCEG